MSNPILLVDLAQRELTERRAARNRIKQLELIDLNKDKTGGLNDAQDEELKQLKAALEKPFTIDEFYRVVATTYLQKSWDDIVKGDGVFAHRFGFLPKRGGSGMDEKLESQKSELVGICGLLQADNYTDVTQAQFRSRIVAAQGEYRQNRELFDAVFKELSQRFPVTLKSQVEKRVFDPNGASILDIDEDLTVSALSGATAAAVVRRLANESVSANDYSLKNRIANAFDTHVGVVNGAPPSSLDIVLPDLEEATDTEIIASNLHATQAIYFSYMLEEMRLFQVVDKILDLFRQGMLPLGKGRAGDYLYRYYKDSSTRIVESERRDLYLRAFGAPGGDPNGNLPNRDFSDLWLRFISAVSNFARQLSVEKMLRQGIPLTVNQEQVRKSGRDLAANLSLHGYGIAYFAATELQSTISEFRDLLQNSEIKGAFGARDMWQVVDQVNANYLGGPRNSQKYRTQARSGAIVIRWLANNADRLSGRFGSDVISLDAFISPVLRSLGSDNPTVSPTDWDLVQACEQWLAVAGVGDQSVEQYSQASESPVTTSKPIEMPAMAREALRSAGVNLM